MPALSLRQKIIAAGITDEAAVRAKLRQARAIILSVPNIDLNRFNPIRPMENIHEG